jgi:hypothetical protein
VRPDLIVEVSAAFALSMGSAGATAPDSYTSAAICTPMIY